MIKPKRTMMKLNSFRKLLWFACHKKCGRSLSRLNLKGERCGAGWLVVGRVGLSRYYSKPSFHEQRYNGNNLFTDPSANLTEIENLNTMTDPERPTATHVSCGGAFVAYSNESNDDWQPSGGLLTALGESLAALPLEEPSNFRTWEPVNVSTASIEGTNLKFRVVSYNMLAQCLLDSHPHLYTKCALENLRWNTRSIRLYDEIFTYNPDIICLQEVQASHLATFYVKFDQTGYFGIFKQKTGQRDDGCAIYFKKSMFEMQDHLTVEMHQEEVPILDRDNVGIMLKLAPKNWPVSSIVVATTHLLYNPKRTDIRLAQMQLFLAELDRFAYFNNGKQYGHLPIILTGDLNSTPDSAVIELLDKGLVSAYNTSDWKRIGVTDSCQHVSVFLDRLDGHTTDYADIYIHNSDYCVPRRKCTLNVMSDFFNTGVIGHNLCLTSVYDKFKKNGDSEASAYQDDWVTVDYIYYSRCNNLTLTERLRLPTISECEKLGSLPNEMYGSDHLALAATFELKPSIYNPPCETQ